MAILVGHSAHFPSGLPDNRRPDVLRIDIGRKRIFIGDAKDTEPPTSRATLARLQRYVLWLTAGLRAGYTGTFAVCFGTKRHANGWRSSIEMLLRECDVAAQVDSVWFGEDTGVVYASIIGTRDRQCITVADSSD